MNTSLFCPKCNAQNYTKSGIIKDPGDLSTAK